jgi:dynein heavy chain
MYHKIAKGLLPTPAKSHYTFNLRDLSKVFQGVMQGTPTQIKQPVDLVRLWSHECMRVFRDRLIHDDDRLWFMGQVEDISKSRFSLDYKKQVRGDNDILIYGNFGDPKSEVKTYEEIADHRQLKATMEFYLEEYNADTSVPMNLVLFMNAIEHISRISRVINQPKGNALLVGVGGSGRKSVTRLAVFVANFRLFQIEISKTYGKVEWREDLKRVFNLAGVENQPTVFLFSDTQIVQESFLEDINGILNTGEVCVPSPNSLFFSSLLFFFFFFFCFFFLL